MDFDVSDLPLSWKAEPLKDAADFTRKPRELTLPTTVPFVPMDLLSTTGVYATRSESRSVDALTSGTYVEDGDVMVAKITPCFENGKQGILAVGYPFAYATTEVIPLRGRPTKTDTLFLHFLLLHPGLRANLASQMEGSTNRQRLPKTVVEKALVPVPPLDEQRQIAAVLSAVQRAIERQERLIALTAELKKALMHKLFTEGTRGEPLKKTAIGPVPQSWMVTPLKQFTESLQYGTSVKCGYDVKGSPVLRIPNVVGGHLDVTDLKFGNPKKNELQTVRLRTGDLLFVRTNGVRENAGRCSMYRGELGESCYFASYLIRVRLRDDLMPAFLEEYTRTENGVRLLAGRAARTADGKFNINTGTLDTLLVPKPDIDEQKLIANALASMDRKARNHAASKASVEALFRTLLHQLMTAQIRVRDLSALKVAPQPVGVA